MQIGKVSLLLAAMLVAGVADAWLAPGLGYGGWGHPFGLGYGYGGWGNPLYGGLGWGHGLGYGGFGYGGWGYGGGLLGNPWHGYGLALRHPLGIGGPIINGPVAPIVF